MTLSVDLFWSVRSPYSWLSVDRIMKMSQDYELEVNVRQVYPIAIRNPEFFKKVDPKFMKYLMLDFKRMAEYLEIPCTGFPTPDPVVQDMETLEIPEEQPLIYRMVHYGVEAAKQGKGLAYIHAVGHLYYSSGLVWTEGDHLAKTLNKIGMNLDELESKFDKNFEKNDAIINENQSALETAGHWGVPNLVFKNEPFFGQDRVDVCLWRMKQHGLRQRKV